MDKATDWKNIFDHSCDFLFPKLQENEILTCAFTGEDTYFIRFNNGKVRQATHALQGDLQLEMVLGSKKSSLSLMLCDDNNVNEKHLENALLDLQETLPTLPDDPFIIPTVDNGTSTVTYTGNLPKTSDVLEDITSLTKGVDLAGLWTSGDCYRGNRNSLGQSHWFSSRSFFFDYSLYTAKERAVKGHYSGTEYIKADLESSLNQMRSALVNMEKEKTSLQPGKYRCYLAPSAVAEIMEVWAWGGLSGSALKKGESFMLDYVEGDATFSPQLTLQEDFSLGLTPPFNENGEVAPTSTTLIDKGLVKALLVSRKTEKEFGLKSNFANGSESPRSLTMGTGNLALDDILKELGTGLYISNLHYLNWSDRQTGRITGMTRFGCLWVEGGQIKGPIKDMRFDELISHIFGDGLLAVTDFSNTNVEIGSYDQREIGGNKIPGILVDQFTFTL